MTTTLNAVTLLEQHDGEFYDIRSQCERQRRLLLPLHKLASAFRLNYYGLLDLTGLSDNSDLVDWMRVARHFSSLNR